MKNRTWRAAGILGGAMAIAVSSGTLVQAAESNDEISKEQSAKSVLETIAWDQKTAAANVETYANIRTGASADSEVLGVLPKGAAGQVIEEGEEWTKISSGNMEGYVKTELLVFGDEAKKLYDETFEEYGTVEVDSLRVRSAASIDAEQTGSRSRGSMVKILGKDGDWYQVETNGQTGYMFGEYIKIKDWTAVTLDELATASSTTAVVNVSGSELDLLAAIIQCEAGGESHTGKVAVGAVIMNRVKSGSFPNTITDVVYQGGQFSPVASGRLASVLGQGAREDCYQAAREALSGSNPVGGALYFNSGSGKGMQIGNQHFY